jgi:molybdopterin converting factor small subunit
MKCIKVTVNFLPVFSRFLRKERKDLTFEKELPVASTVTYLFGLLAEDFGGLFVHYVYDEKDRKLKSVNVLLNGVSLRNKPLNVELRDGDQIVVAPIYAGG